MMETRRTRPFIRRRGQPGRTASLAAALLLAAACAPLGVPAPAPAPVGIPAVPEVRGELGIDVVYPGEDQQITARDSTFIFGSVGHGGARLTINGAEVRVAPNGGWLAFLPVPADGLYRLAAEAEGQRVTAERRVRVPAAAPTAPTLGEALRIVPGSVTPTGAWTGVRGERVEIRFRGTPGARARLILPDGRALPMTELAAVDRETGFMLDRAVAQPGVAEYVGYFPLDLPIATPDTAVAAPTLAQREGHVEPRQVQPPRGALVELVRGRDTVRVPVAAAFGVLEPMAPRVAVVRSTRADEVAVGRRMPAGGDNPFAYFFPNGTRLEVTGEQSGHYRVRLTDGLTTWVSAGDLELLPPGAPAPRGQVITVGLTPGAEEAGLRISLTERLPFRVFPAERGVTVEIYGALDRTSYVFHGETDPFVESIRWEQPSDDLYRLHLELGERLWGWQADWAQGSTLALRLRRAPRVDAAAPLRGVRIGVDAGHPPGGAIGPTRLTEADANLMVARRLVRMLEERGAEVLEIRPDTATVPLAQRPLMATAADVHLLVSVHFNAFPDGVNPFRNQGTMMFYYWEPSLPFARHLQREILAELGLPDRGVRFQNLAMTRTTWMPSVLTESLFMMIPEHEAALRNPAVQEGIAAAHLRAVESFLREVAASP
jgi:N-acetylmuramoyl-L-alanine amidase